MLFYTHSYTPVTLIKTSQIHLPSPLALSVKQNIEANNLPEHASLTVYPQVSKFKTIYLHTIHLFPLRSLKSRCKLKKKTKKKLPAKDDGMIPQAQPHFTLFSSS